MRGGIIPAIGFQSTIERPESVNRVIPPRRIIPNMVTAQAINQAAICLSYGEFRASILVDIILETAVLPSVRLVTKDLNI